MVGHCLNFPLVSAALINLGSQGGGDLAAPFCKAPWISQVITLGFSFAHKYRLVNTCYNNDYYRRQRNLRIDLV